MSKMSQDPAITPTPHKEVNTLLSFMLDKVQAILKDQLVGFYLYGSLSLGDFDPAAASDVDFLVVTEDVLPEEALEKLRAMHAEIAESGLPYATHLEGSYIPRAAMRRYDLANAHHPTIGIDWPFQVAFHDSNWVLQYHTVREYGVIVWGPEPRTLIDPVSSADLRAAVCLHLKNFWQKTVVEDIDWLRPRDYQGYAVLTLCRALYTLHNGDLCSKPKAAAWAQETYPHWQPIIERSLLWRSQHEIDDLTESMAFLHEALALAQGMCE
jgi:predicted nucleotidyltransferase